MYCKSVIDAKTKYALDKRLEPDECMHTAVTVACVCGTLRVAKQHVNACTVSVGVHANWSVH